ncbi:lysylphosphatidylglycerol synthase domain-containing protein [soil metagenome]
MTRSPRWVLVRRIATLAFIVLVVTLVTMQARAVDWGAVVASIQSYSIGTLLLAVACAVASYSSYSCFDLLGRHYTGHGLPTRQVVKIAFISYAFNLNLGAMIGGAGFRFRLYSQLGLDNATIARVLGISFSTNWLGYMVLTALLFTTQLVTAPEGWTASAEALKVSGYGLGLLVVAYVAACVIWRNRVFTVRGVSIALPGWRMALLQVAMSTINWSLIASVIHVLLQGAPKFAHTLGALLAAAMAGAVTHVPGGLGVLETVFVTLLGDEIDTPTLLAALLTYRAIYYLVPLLIASTLFIVFEARMRSQRLRATYRT